MSFDLCICVNPSILGVMCYMWWPWRSCPIPNTEYTHYLLSNKHYTPYLICSLPNTKYHLSRAAGGSKVLLLQPYCAHAVCSHTCIVSTLKKPHGKQNYCQPAHLRAGLIVCCILKHDRLQWQPISTSHLTTSQLAIAQNHLIQTARINANKAKKLTYSSHSIFPNHGNTFAHFHVKINTFGDCLNLSTHLVF